MPDRHPAAADAPRTDRLDLRALFETSRLLSGSLDLDFVLGNLLLVAMSKLLVTRGVALLDDPLTSLAGGGYRVAAAKGIRGLAAGDVVDLGPSPGDGSVPPALAAHGIALALPIAFEERPVGVVALGPKATRQPFSEDEVRFARALVDMSAAAVHNARAVDELQEANRELADKVQQLHTLFDLAQEFGRTLEADRALKLLGFALMGQLLVGRYAVLLRGADGGPLEVVAEKGPALPPEAPALLTGLDRLALLDADADEAWAPLREAGYALALPLRSGGVSRGALVLGPKASRRPFDAGEVEFLTALGALAVSAVETARAVEMRLEKERLEEDLRLARTIQERLLPQTLPTFEGAELAAAAEASRFVAGDYYDVLRLDDDRLLVAVADVSGKGLPASLLMANLQACLHVLRGGPALDDLAAATARVNRVIHANTGSAMFITFFWGVWERSAGRLRYVNAGHNPPIVFRPDGAREELHAGGPLLGILADMTFEQGETAFGPGDLLALYTDGVTEAWGVLDPDDEFGEGRLADTLARHRAGAAAEALAALRDAVFAHTGGRALEDDLTVLLLKGTG